MKQLLFTFFTVFIIRLTFSQGSSSLSTSELITNSTIRIEGHGDTLIDGRKISFTSTGTGFYFQFKFDSITVPVIVTNYHVIENTKTGILRFTEENSDKTPAYGKIVTEQIDNFSAKWIKHPSEDLAILPLNPILNDIQKNKHKNVFVVYYDETLLPSKQFLDEGYFY